MKMKVSVIIPVYNEEATLEKVVKNLRQALPDAQLIIVDDGSEDATKKVIGGLVKEDPSLEIIFSPVNKGKGASIRKGLALAKGEIIAIQDADLEYAPQDLIPLIEMVKAGKAEVAYGSRFKRGRGAASLGHYLANRFLTSLTNMLYHSILTDMETCYKVFRADVIKGLKLTANRFEIEPEMTLKALKAGYQIKEYPISYKGRAYHEGKKITWRDGIKAILLLLRYKFFKKHCKIRSQKLPENFFKK